MAWLCHRQHSDWVHVNWRMWCESWWQSHAHAYTMLHCIAHASCGGGCAVQECGGPPKQQALLWPESLPTMSATSNGNQRTTCPSAAAFCIMHCRMLTQPFSR